MQQFAAPKSRPWATACGARIAHLAAKCCQMLPNAAKCWKNAGKFFPDVAKGNRRAGLSTGSTTSI